MFSGIVNTIGFTPFFLITLMLATVTTPAGMILKRSRPIIGTGILSLGLVGQVVWGLAVAGGMVSDTVLAFLVGAPQ